MPSDRNPRQVAILAEIHKRGRVYVDALAQSLNATPQTIRRDLQILSDAHEIMRFHGGATLPAGTEYTDFEVRTKIAAEEKRAIGAAVAARIPHNTFVMINAGTTTASVARNLESHFGLNLLTDNVALANEIRQFPGVEVIVPGGTLRRSDGAILGGMALDFLKQFRADVAVIGAAAIDHEGNLYDFDTNEVLITREMIKLSKHVILAVDSTKFGNTAPIFIDDLSGVQTLVTDRPSDTLISLCNREGIELVTAGR